MKYSCKKFPRLHQNAKLKVTKVQLTWTLTDYVAGWTLIKLTTQKSTRRLFSPARRVHLNDGGIRRERRGAQVASQQGVERCAKWSVCSAPVRLQVFCQMFAGVLELVLIQNYIKHLLRWKRGAREGWYVQMSPHVVVNRKVTKILLRL